MKLRSSIQQLATACLVMTSVSSSYLFSPSHLVPKEFALGWIPWHPLCFDLCGLFIFPLRGVIKLKMPTVACVCVHVQTHLYMGVYALCVEIRCSLVGQWGTGNFLSLLAGTGITSVCLLAFNVGAGTWTQVLMYVHTLYPWAFNHLLCKGELYSLSQNSVLFILNLLC